MLLVVLAACGQASVTTATSSAGPITTLSYADQGKALYDRYCAHCHGVDLQGGKAGTDLLGPEFRADQMDDTAYLVAVTDGVPAGKRPEFSGMAAVAGLDHSDIARITAYIRQRQDETG